MGENVTPFMFVEERGIPATNSGRVHPHIFLGVRQTQGPRRSKKKRENANCIHHSGQTDGRRHMAMGQNLWYHIWVDEHP